jgi:hypothetical protein
VTEGRLVPDPRHSRAVVVGIGVYDDPDCRDQGMAIETIENSAQLVYELLKRGAIWGLPAESVELLRTTERGTVSRRAVADALRSAARRCREGGALLVYFVGHGTIRPSPAEDLFLATGDCLYEERDTYLSASDLFESCHQVFLHTDGREPAVLPVVAFFDCCHAGAAMSHLGGQSEPELIPKLRRRDVYVVGAARSGNRADPHFHGDPAADRTAFSGVFLEVIGNGVEGHGPDFSLDEAVRLITERSAAYQHPQVGVASNELGTMLLAANPAHRSGAVPDPAAAAGLSGHELAARLGGVDDEGRAAVLRALTTTDLGWQKAVSVLRRLQSPPGVLARCVTPQNARSAVTAVHALHDLWGDDDVLHFASLLHRDGGRAPARLAAALDDHACANRNCQKLSVAIRAAATRGDPADYFGFMRERRAEILKSRPAETAAYRVCQALAADARAYGEACAASGAEPGEQARRVDELAALLTGDAPWGAGDDAPQALAQAGVARQGLFQTAGRTLPTPALADLVDRLSRAGRPRRGDLAELCLAVATRRSGARIVEMISLVEQPAARTLTTALIRHGSARTVAEAAVPWPASSEEGQWRHRVLESVVAQRGIGFAAAVYAALTAVDAAAARRTLVDTLLHGSNMDGVVLLIDHLKSHGLHRTVTDQVGRIVLPADSGAQPANPALIAAYLQMSDIDPAPELGRALFQLSGGILAQVYAHLDDPVPGDASPAQRALLARARGKLVGPELTGFLGRVLGERPAHLDALADALLPPFSGDGPEPSGLHNLAQDLNLLDAEPDLAALVARMLERVVDRFATRDVIRVAANLRTIQRGTGGTAAQLVRTAMTHPAHRSGASQSMLGRCLPGERQRLRALDRVTARFALEFAAGDEDSPRQLVDFLRGLDDPIPESLFRLGEIDEGERIRWVDDFFDTVVEVVTANHRLVRLALALRTVPPVRRGRGRSAAAAALLENWLSRDVRIDYEDAARILRAFRRAGAEDLCRAAARTIAHWQWRDVEDAVAVIRQVEGGELAHLADLIERFSRDRDETSLAAQH